jgi:surfactin synthase thioesterase subunit
MPTEIELCPIQLPGRENRRSEPPFNRLKSLIQTLTPLIAPYLDIPFAFFGHSMGALLSFELIRELRRQNLPSPMHLFLSGHPAPQIPDFEPPIHTLPEPQFIEALRKLQGTPEAVLQDSELMQHYLPILRADFAMLETYFYVKEAPLNCPISVFGGLEDKRVSLAALEAWREQTTQGFTVNQLSGDHFFLQLSQKELLKLVLEKFSKQLINQ